MFSVNNDTLIKQTKQWIKSFIIEYNLCPFAARPFQSDRIDYSVCTETHLENLLEYSWAKITNLMSTDEVQTGFVLFPTLTFDQLLELKDTVDYLLEETDHEDVIQVVAFHPDFIFDESQTENVSNYVNRSPYPMLHILRQEDITAVSDIYNVDGIPLKNTETLTQLGLQHIKQILSDIQ